MDIRKNISPLVVLLFCLLSACVGTGGAKADGVSEKKREQTEKKKAGLIRSVSPLYGTYVTQGESQRIVAELGAEVDSVVLSIGGSRVTALDTAGYVYATDGKHPTGRIVYRITAYRDGDSDSRTGEFTILAAKAPILYGHKVLRQYPHNADSYTQGLLWHNGSLYESTGLEGRSSVRRVELATGRPVVTKKLDDNLFGEGLALLDGKLYQLTWQNNKAFVYDLETFDKVGEFDYSGEGWGLTTDGKHLYMSDGSEKIYVLDPETFRRIRTIEVYTDQSKVAYVNEMEWIKGEIWANVYMTDTIIRIDPQTGAVTGAIDMSGLLSEADVTPAADVLNGIAYDARTGRIFVTGKNWNKLFEISVHPK